MASPRGSYDRGLLASAPVATRADRQGGYDVDLLENDPYGGPSHSSSRLTLPIPRSPAHTDQGLPFKEERVFNASNSKARKPFWRTGKGRTIILIAAIVILGAVIGGAVGGTAKKHKSNNPMTASSAPAQSDSGSSPSSTPTAPEGSGNASIVSASQSGAPIASNAQIGSPTGGQFASDVAATTIPTASVSPGSGVQAFAGDP